MHKKKKLKSKEEVKRRKLNEFNEWKKCNLKTIAGKRKRNVLYDAAFTLLEMSVLKLRR